MYQTHYNHAFLNKFFYTFLIVESNNAFSPKFCIISTSISFCSPIADLVTMILPLLREVSVCIFFVNISLINMLTKYMFYSNEHYDFCTILKAPEVLLQNLVKLIPFYLSLKYAFALHFQQPANIKV